jgi:translation elongation factor EF-Tu-like GTPase
MATRFSFVVEDVLRIEGRGTVLVGDFPPDAPPFKSGELVTIVRDGAIVLTCPATVEHHTPRGKAGLNIS